MIDNHDKVETHTNLIERIKPQVGDTLGPLVEHMGTSSLFNLASALDAMHVDGVGGKLTMRIPPKDDSRIEVDWRPTRNVKRHD